MTLPSVSVVIPTRDRPDMVLRAVRSVLAQQLPPAELLVVDDGGASDLSRRLREIATPGRLRLHVLRGPRRGPGAARNVGVQAARGDLVAFLDDDDIWLPHKLDWQVPWFVRQPRLGLLGSGRIAAERMPVPVAPPRARPTRLQRVSRAALIRANRFATSTVVVRRECIDECSGFDESLVLAQDWDLWLRIAGPWRAAMLPAPLAVYTVHGGQRSADSAAMREWEVAVLERLLNRPNGPTGRLRAIARRRLAWAHCRVGRALLRSARVEEARACFISSLSCHMFQPMAWAGLARCALLGTARAGGRST